MTTYKRGGSWLFRFWRRGPPSKNPPSLPHWPVREALPAWGGANLIRLKEPHPLGRSLQHNPDLHREHLP